MPLSAESLVVIDVLQKSGVPPLIALPPAEGRAFFNAAFATKPEDQEAVASVRELSIPVAGGSIRARLYSPKAGKLPVLVHYHGGGWVLMWRTPRARPYWPWNTARRRRSRRRYWWKTASRRCNGRSPTPKT